MKKLILLTYFIFSSAPAVSFMEPVNQISENEKKITDQLQISKGGLTMFEQHLTREKGYNQTDAYRLEFICQKSNPRQDAKCSVVQYEILEKKTR